MTIIYLNKKTGRVFRTNYYDHFNNYMMTDEGLMSFKEALTKLEGKEVSRNIFESVERINYRT